MYEITRNVLAEVKKAIVGKDDVISKVWICLLYTSDAADE